MNTKLKEQLVEKMKKLAVFQVERSGDWIMGHIDRLCSEFGFIGEKLPVKIKLSDGIKVVTRVNRILINEHAITVDTGYGNYWYYDVQKPTDEEVAKFDGNSFVV